MTEALHGMDGTGYGVGDLTAPLSVHLPGGWASLPAWIQICAFLVVLALSLWFAERRGLDVRTMYWAGVLAIPGALLGAQLWVGTSQWLTDGSAEFAWGGARGVFGAFGGALVVGCAYLLWRRRSPLVYADAAVPAVALGYAIARLGCLLAGDDFGIVTEQRWGLRFGIGTEAYAVHLDREWITPSDRASMPVHPTQLYHSLVGAAGFVLLCAWRPRWHGSGLAVWLAFYGITRFIIEFFRDNYLESGAPLDTAQWGSIAFVLGAAGLWMWHRLSLSHATTAPAG